MEIVTTPVSEFTPEFIWGDTCKHYHSAWHILNTEYILASIINYLMESWRLHLDIQI